MTVAAAATDRMAQPTQGAGRARPTTWPLLVVAVGLGVLTGLAPATAIVAVAAIGVLALVSTRPASAAYLWLLVTPLVVGIERGRLLPVLRPNEALLLLLVVALAGRWAVLRVWRRAEHPHLALSRVDVGFLLLLLTGSALPVLWMAARGAGVSADDMSAASVVAKYYLLFLVFRLAVRSERQVWWCLWASMAAAVVVAVLAVLQSMDLLGVRELLAGFWGSSGGPAPGRGSATIGNAHGAADFLTFNLAISLALAFRQPAGRSARIALTLSAVFLLGALGSGQASSVIGLFVCLLALGWVLGRLPRVLAGGVVAAPLAVAALAPVIAARLSSLDPSTGLPSSWLARWHNLSTYFWPQLFDGYGWLLGVRALPEATGAEVWQPVVYIESGHTWFLWIGGVPYLLAFAIFIWIALRASRTAAREQGAFGVAGAAAFAAYCTVFVLTALDPHLFLRGSADIAVPLLALAITGATRRHGDRPADPGTPSDEVLDSRGTASSSHGASREATAAAGGG